MKTLIAILFISTLASADVPGQAYSELCREVCTARNKDAKKPAKKKEPEACAPDTLIIVVEKGCTPPKGKK